MPGRTIVVDMIESSAVNNSTCCQLPKHCQKDRRNMISLPHSRIILVEQLSNEILQNEERNGLLSLPLMPLVLPSLACRIWCSL